MIDISMENLRRTINLSAATISLVVRYFLVRVHYLIPTDIKEDANSTPVL